MLEIRNKTKHPVQLLVKSTRAPRSFSVLNIPGLGCGKNIYFLEDERTTDYIDRAERDGLISTKRLPNKTIKGE